MWVSDKFSLEEHVVLPVLACLLLSVWPGPATQFFVPGLLVGLTWKLDITYAVSMIFGVFFIAILVSLKVGSPGAQIILAETLGLTILLYVARYKNWPGPQAVLAGLSYLISYTVLILVLSAKGDLLFAFEELGKAVAHELDTGFKLYRESNAVAYRPEFDIWFGQIKTAVIRLLPGLMCLTFLAASFSNVIVTRVFLRKRNAPEEVFGPAFPMWKVPEYFVWPGILAAAVALSDIGGYSVAAENCLLVLGGLYFLQGFSITEFIFKTFKLPFFVRVLVFFLFLIQWYGLLTIAALGLLDIWFDFRARFTPVRTGQA